MTLPSLQEAERIADKLLKAIEEGRPLLKDMQHGLRDVQTAINRYKALEASVGRALDKVTEMLAEAKDTYQLILDLEANSNEKLTMIAENAKTVHKELENLAKDRQELELKYGTHKNNPIQDITGEVVGWRFMKK
jgi:hypothetical protein